MKSFYCVPLIVYCIFFFSCGNNSTKKTSEVIPIAIGTQGQTLFESNCTNCHGEDGKLCALGAKDLSLSNLTKEQKMEIITNGKSTMTSFGNILNKEEVSAVADYVETLKGR